MSELKERDARELVINNLAYYPNEESMRVYLKSEADKVIAEKDKEIAELNSDIADLRDDKKATDAILDERNAELAKLQAIIEERDKTIEGLQADYKNTKLKEADDGND